MNRQDRQGRQEVKNKTWTEEQAKARANVAPLRNTLASALSPLAPAFDRALVSWCLGGENPLPALPLLPSDLCLLTSAFVHF